LFGWGHPDFVEYRRTLTAIHEEIETPEQTIRIPQLETGR
jgi:hypothetical protein